MFFVDMGEEREEEGERMEMERRERGEIW